MSSISPSPYARSAADAHLQATQLLLEALDLPHQWRSGDPDLGERTGMLMVQAFEDGTGAERSLECLFVASATFADYWSAMHWAISTGVSLDHAIVRITLPPAKGVLRLEKSSSGKITMGNPRSPLRTPKGQSSHLWVVDVMCPLRLVLLIGRDRLCGHV